MALSANRLFARTSIVARASACFARVRVNDGPGPVASTLYVYVLWRLGSPRPRAVHPSWASSGVVLNAHRLKSQNQSGELRLYTRREHKTTKLPKVLLLSRV